MSDIEFNLEGFQEKFKKDHRIKYWFDENFSWIKLGYAPHYSVTHPHVLFMDLCREIRWACQRTFKGHDERVSWSIDYWLNPIMIKELNVLKKNKHGVPAKFFKSQEESENEDFQEAQKLWFAELDKMILGFECAQKLADLNYDWKNKNAEKELLDNFYIGMNSFQDNYFSLCD